MYGGRRIKRRKAPARKRAPAKRRAPARRVRNLPHASTYKRPARFPREPPMPYDLYAKRPRRPHTPSPPSSSYMPTQYPPALGEFELQYNPLSHLPEGYAMESPPYQPFQPSILPPPPLPPKNPITQELMNRRLRRELPNLPLPPPPLPKEEMAKEKGFFSNLVDIFLPPIQQQGISYNKPQSPYQLPTLPAPPAPLHDSYQTQNLLPYTDYGLSLPPTPSTYLSALPGYNPTPSPYGEFSPYYQNSEFGGDPYAQQQVFASAPPFGLGARRRRPQVMRHNGRRR